MINRPPAQQQPNRGQTAQQLRNLRERLKDWLKNLFRRSPAQTPPTEGPTTRVGRIFPDEYVRIGASAYISSVLVVGTVIPIVISLAAVKIYLALSSTAAPPFTLLFLTVRPTSHWYTFAWSVFVASLIWLAISLPFSWFCTHRGANSHNYGLFRSRLHQLNSRLGLHDYQNNYYDEINDIKAVIKNAGFDVNNQHVVSVLKEAYDCRTSMCRNLCKYPTGLSWATGTAYNKMWSLIHHAEEAMIEVDDLNTVLRQAKHDFDAIKDSNIKNEKDLLRDIRIAVKTLKPEDLPYFALSQPDKSEHLPRGKDDPAARVVLREVRSTLNQFRDRRWEGLVRQRSRLLTTIGVTGIVTHALLSTIILAHPFSADRIGELKDVQQKILAATVFYAVGAIVGLFARLYSESQRSLPIDDFGLSRVRLVAVPLLSGLAGIMGVVLTLWGGLTATNTVGLKETLPTIFSFNPALWVIAAIFGIAPSLLINGLQNKANQYRSELQSTTVESSNGHTDK